MTSNTSAVAAIIFSSIGLVLAVAGSVSSSNSPDAPNSAWEPLSPVVPGLTATFYSPTTARLESDRGATIRAVDIKREGADGQVVYETWRVNVATCQERFVDIAIYQSGQPTTFRRSLSTSEDAKATCGAASPALLRSTTPP